MSSTFGNVLHLSIFGQSHSPAIGCSLDGIPAGIAVDQEKLQAFLDRRAPGRDETATKRREADAAHIIAGVVDGHTTGAPIAAIIENTNTRSKDYSELRRKPRPGHADYPARVKYHNMHDVAGGGHFSGRLTAPLCIAGGIALQALEAHGIQVMAHVAQIGGISDLPMDDMVYREADRKAILTNDLPCIDAAAAGRMREEILAARDELDSIGGIVECGIYGLPAGIGDPMFDGIENRIAQIAFGIPAVKGVEFGMGFAVAAMRGSENNDPYRIDAETGKIEVDPTRRRHPGRYFDRRARHVAYGRKADALHWPRAADRGHGRHGKYRTLGPRSSRSLHRPPSCPRSRSSRSAGHLGRPPRGRRPALTRLTWVACQLCHYVKGASMDLADIRQTIDGIDTTLLNSFVERMDIATEVAKSKIEMGKAVFDPARERSKLNNLASRAPERYEAQTITLFRLLMSMSKAEQQRYINELKGITVSQKAHATAAAFDTPFPQTATVACQGVEGAYSQIAACKLFDVPDIAFFETFEGVMRAVRDGFCEFGVLPIENSTAGSVNAVYDLLAQFDFHIVRSLRLKIDHNMLVKPGTKLADVREVYSHGQAIAQCAGFIESHDLHATKYPNTAMSAEMVANSDRTDVAAIASRSCAALYGLEVLESNIQDSDNNYTRFVVISREPRVYPGANRTSLMITTANEPGALYRVLERFYALNINLIKLESRPIPGRDFEFMFYFDLDCPFGSKALDDLLDSIDDVCESFTYFGSYTEVL